MTKKSSKQQTNKRYSIGLDIGVASVGWSCMTPDFRILKHNGRYAMGVREFESAETAETRRMQRGTRRGYNRRIKRLQLLQQTVSPLFKNDPSYFIESNEKEKHFWRNSNHFENNSLSETLNYLKMNNKKYPTIYHLRSALLEGGEKFHPRLIYLALHNLVKYRGHFLNENMNWKDGEGKETLQTLLSDYFNELTAHYYNNKEFNYKDYEGLIEILENNYLTNADKRKNILEIVGKDLKEPVSLVLGLKANVAKLFPESDQLTLYKEEKLGINFTDEDITEVVDKLTDKERLLVEKANVIHQSISLRDLLGEAHCVAEAKVNQYNRFRQDLKLLKNLYNQYLGESDYHDIFITSKKNQKKYTETKDIQLLCEFDKFLKAKNKYEEKFYKNLRKTLETLHRKEPSTQDEQNLINKVRQRLDNQQFLKKLNDRDNAAIPHQNNVYEAEKILKNQQRYYPDITNEMIEKIKQIISFRIPYYIGPITKENEASKFGWVSRKQKQKHVTPWNFYEVVDRSQSAEDFINNMTGYCAYLTNEKVLPKHSLTYEEFELLNELNGIQIRPYQEMPDKKFRLSREEKEWLVTNVFTRYKTVTHKILKRELKNSPFKRLIIDENTGGLKSIYGTQKEDRFGSSLSSFIDMQRIFGSLKNINFDMLEEVIYWITVFEEKDIIAMKIREKYSGISEKQINNLINLNYTGWGRLSKCIIDELPADEVNHLTILDIMKNEPSVFMEVMAVEKYNLNERIADINLQGNKTNVKIKYQDIAELQGSPAIKKGIWQAVSIIEELTDIFGEPENIMIEFAKEVGRKQRTNSRKTELSELEKAINKDEKELKRFIKNNLRYDEKDYRDNRLFLYITQIGKCLYSGESLNVNQLQEYEVDHILPRNFVKDNSIANRALVKKHMNQDKDSQKMPLELLDDQHKVKQKMFWKKLFDNKLISRKKYNNLLKETFSDQDKEGFFARQLVETRQITKHVRDLLNERFEHTEIHMVNANIVTGLREHSNMLKLRDLNNKHHAVDAALAVMIIEFIIDRYGTNFLNFNFKYQEARKKWRKMLAQHKKNFFLFSDIDKYKKFIHFQTGEMLTGREFLSSLNDEMPWQTTKKVGTNEAAFYDETLYSPKDIKGKNPQYTSSKLSKGVHSSMGKDSSYLISYKYLDNKNREKSDSRIVDLFIIEKYQLKNYSQHNLAMFLAQKVAKGEITAAKIHTKILKHQLIIVDGHPLYFVSADEMNNAKQFRPYLDVLDKLYKVINTDDTSQSLLQQIFIELSHSAIYQYRSYLPESKKRAIENYAEKVKDRDSFFKGVQELLKMASASAARSNIFGGRYERKLNTAKAKFIHQSITGLRYRKPKSYKNELWLS